ncbi:MAG: DUF5816 domain-containing protein [Halanaeroarchaeum sp.]
METVAVDDTTLYLEADERLRGQAGDFVAAYRGDQRDALYGWYCTNCESLDNAMDTMGRIRCNECGNLRKPDRWDAAHE